MQIPAFKTQLLGDAMRAWRHDFHRFPELGGLTNTELQQG